MKLLLNAFRIFLSISLFVGLLASCAATPMRIRLKPLKKLKRQHCRQSRRYLRRNRKVVILKRSLRQKKLS